MIEETHDNCSLVTGIKRLGDKKLTMPMDNNIQGSIGGPQYIKNYPHIAIPFLTIASVASVVGTLGNLFILGAILLNKNLRNARSVFLVNLAVADLIITSVADPFGIVGMVKGNKYFDERPTLCNFVATLCLTTCVAALFSIGGISFNRYFHICHHSIYQRIFTLRHNIIMCGLFWCIGLGFSLPSLLGWSRNVYDHKMLECIWDRTHSLSFTIFFSSVIVSTPALIIAFSYLRIYMYVRSSSLRLAALGVRSSFTGNVSAEKSRTIKLTRTFFIVFLIFIGCWSPYAIIVLVDFDDKLPHEVHLYILLLAHLHSSMNCFVYFFTSQHFKVGYRKVFYLLTCKEPDVSTPDVTLDRSNNHSIAQTATNDTILYKQNSVKALTYRRNSVEHKKADVIIVKTEYDNMALGMNAHGLHSRGPHINLAATNDEGNDLCFTCKQHDVHYADVSISAVSNHPKGVNDCGRFADNIYHISTESSTRVNEEGDRASELRSELQMVASSVEKSRL